MQCLHCQHDNLANATFCEQCGTQLASVCPICGAPQGAEPEPGTASLRHLFGPVIPIAAVTLAVLLTVWLVGLPKHEINPANKVQVELTSESKAELANLLKYQLDEYKANLSRLDSIIALQALLVATTVLLVVRRSDSLMLFGNSIPLSWLHVFVPLLLAYVWFSFGFTMNDLIWGRIRGVEIIKAASRPTKNLEKAIFNDAGVINGWFVAFIDRPDEGNRSEQDYDYSGSSQASPGVRAGFLVTSVTAGFLVLILGTLTGAAHACMLAIVPIGCRRYLRIGLRRSLLWYYVSPLAPLIILLITHVQFAYGGAHRNWAQLYVAAATIPLIMFFLWLSAAVDRRSSPASLQCLSGQRTT